MMFLESENGASGLDDNGLFIVGISVFETNTIDDKSLISYLRILYRKNNRLLYNLGILPF